MRYFKATLLIGLISILAIGVFDATGWLHTLDQLTAQLLGHLSPGGSLKWTAHPVVFAVAAFLAFAFAWATVDLARGKALMISPEAFEQASLRKSS